MHSRFPARAIPNISVKAAPAYGLRWTSRKRAAPYLKRWAYKQSSSEKDQ